MRVVPLSLNALHAMTAGELCLPPSMPSVDKLCLFLSAPLELYATKVGVTVAIFWQVVWLSPSLPLSPLRSDEVGEVIVWILTFFFLLLLLLLLLL